MKNLKVDRWALSLTRASCMICLDSEARHLKQRPFSGLVNKNTGAGYSPIISVLCVNVAISKTSRTFKSVFFIRCRRSDSSIFVDKWNLASATIARSFSQRPQAAIRQLRAWPRIHVQPRFQRGFRNGVTFLRVVYGVADWHGTKRIWIIHSWPWLVWPWWGGRMYRIVTGVTSDVGVPSTYLVSSHTL